MNNKTEIDFLNYNDLNLVEKKIKECTDRANEAMSPQINKVIDGKSTQETRSGKNLINPNLPVGSETKDGITLTNNGDGTYAVKGTATKTTGIDLTKQEVIKLKGDTYYTNSIEILNGKMDGFITVSVKGKDNVTKFNYLNLGSTFKKNTKKIEEDLTIVRYNYYIESGKTVAFTFRVQLEKGSTATSWEQYGASPSPDYPSEIENVKGKNLINIDNKNDVDTLISVDKDGWITATYDNTNGTTTKYMNYFTNNLNLKTSSKYNAIIEVKSVSGSGSLMLYSSIQNYGQPASSQLFNFNTLLNNSIYNSVFTTRSSFMNITQGIRTFVRFGAGESGSITFRLSVLEDISDFKYVPFRYVPYGNIQIVETGKNLFDKDNAENGYRLGSDGLPFPDKSNILSQYIKVKPNTTYHTNFKLIWSNCICEYSKDKTFILRNQSGLNTFTTSNNCEYIRITCLITQKDELQLQQGTQATEYEPYTEEVVNIDLKGNELCSLPNGTKDELIVKDGRAKILKRIGKVVLDGSNDENWHISSLSVIGYKSYYVDSSIRINQDVTGKCNYFEYKTFNEWKNLLKATFIENSYQTIGIRVTETLAPTLEDFKTWLSTHNTIVQYELATPEEIDLGPLEVYFTYETKKWVINELPYIQEIDRIEKGIYNLGEKYNRPKGWLPTKEWITKDNLYPIKGFDYRDWNRWVNNLNIFTTDIVVKDTIWNGASFINWEQIGKNEWR